MRTGCIPHPREEAFLSLALCPSYGWNQFIFTLAGSGYQKPIKRKRSGRVLKKIWVTSVGGRGNMALQIHSSECTPFPNTLGFWVSQPPPQKLVFVNSVVMATASRENSLFKVESEGDTWRN